MNLNDLRALAPALPPSARLQGAEAADILSALVAIGEHGDGLVEAAKQGPNAVAQVFHDTAVTHAQDNGHPEPEKGQALLEPAPVSSVAAAQSGAIDYDALAKAIVAQQNAQANPPASEDTAGDTGGDTGNAAENRGII